MDTKQRIGSRGKIVTAAVAFVVLGVAGLVAAGPGEPFQAILDAIAALQGDVDDANAKLDALQSDVDDLDAKMDRLEIEVALDPGYCATGGVQCFAVANHTAAAASSSNHNPIRVAVLVTLNGAGVTGLGDANIEFANSFVPAGGGGAGEYEPAACGANCFQTDGSGLYVFFIDRIPAGNWKAGHYFATITVTDTGGHTDEAIADWEIA
ncbi:MAG TPA: hypothetical protein VI893_09715 [Thermoplasmata archaeon]|nr:hypothetical protein [Thermoplasmata archaeon]